jgi:hypothetical protein
MIAGWQSLEKAFQTADLGYVLKETSPRKNPGLAGCHPSCLPMLVAG